MASQRIILVPPELWENRCQTPTPLSPVKKILRTNNHSYNKWTQREPIPIPIIETGSAEPSFKTTPKGNV